MKSDIKKYTTILKENNYKLTDQRKSILTTILEHSEEHLNCDEIFDLVSEKNPEIGIATVYRTIQLFEDLNIVMKMNFNDGFSRYEIRESKNNHHHHHLICISCGKVQEVELDLLDKLEKTIEDQENFDIVDHSVKFYGYCGTCKKI